MRRPRNAGIGCLVVLAAAACGGGDPVDPIEPDPAVAPFVGRWDASEFTFTTDAEPPVVANLLSDGSFTLNIEPSGSYTATLVLGDLTPFVEFGQLSVTGGLITLTPTSGPGPCAAASTYDFLTADRLVLDGPSCLDVNLDGEDEAGEAHIVLDRRSDT